jgi:hypothetical protein
MKDGLFFIWFGFFSWLGLAPPCLLGWTLPVISGSIAEQLEIARQSSHLIEINIYRYNPY